MSSAVTCTLNAYYQDCVESNRFVVARNVRVTRANSWNSYGIAEDQIRDKGAKRTTKVCQLSQALQLSCCGLHELDFQNLAPAFDKYKDDPNWDQLVAVYIKMSVNMADKRVLIVGIPVEVGEHSQYNLPFYEKLRETLESFGFRQLGQPYQNENSKNTIVAMVGKLP